MSDNTSNQSHMGAYRRHILLDQVLDQIQKDIWNGDLTAIEELIGRLPDDNLISYLPEGSYLPKE